MDRNSRSQMFFKMVFLKEIGQYIQQTIHTKFAQTAKLSAWKTWLSALNHLNEIAVLKWNTNGIAITIKILCIKHYKIFSVVIWHTQQKFILLPWLKIILTDSLKKLGKFHIKTSRFSNSRTQWSSLKYAN